MLVLMFPAEEFTAATRQLGNRQSAPPVFDFIADNFRYFFATFLALSASTLVSAIGLLRRRNWARLVLIAIMGLGALWNLASLPMAYYMTSLAAEFPTQTPDGFHDNFKLMWNIMLAFTVLISLAFAALFAWIIKRLTSEGVRREFLAVTVR
jgi:hypothetical protein